MFAVWIYIFFPHIVISVFCFRLYSIFFTREISNQHFTHPGVVCACMYARVRVGGGG